MYLAHYFNADEVSPHTRGVSAYGMSAQRGGGVHRGWVGVSQHAMGQTPPLWIE